MEISIVMPVYNGERYIDDSIPSILNQTFDNFELLIIDDGSTDNSLDKITQYNDQRIRVIQNKHDFIDSLNKGLEFAKGKYIARMDVDDIMESNRLMAQYNLLEQHPEVTVCSCWMKLFGQIVSEIPSPDGILKHPLIRMLQGNIVAHPCTMFRKDFLIKHQIHYENYNYAEDYKLWSEIAKCGGTFYAVPEFLMNYRISSDQVSQQKSTEQYQVSLVIRKEILDYLISHATVEKQRILQLKQLVYSLNHDQIISDRLVFALFYDLFRNLSYTL